MVLVSRIEEGDGLNAAVSMARISAPEPELQTTSVLPAIGVLSVHRLGDTLLLAGHRLVRVEQLAEAREPLLLASVDGSTWTALPVPDGWGTSSVFRLAVGPDGLVAALSSSGLAPGSPADWSVWFAARP